MNDYDPERDLGSVPSPCINVCTMNPRTGLCVGCFRTMDEIVQWGMATNETKRAIWVEIKRRESASFPALQGDGQDEDRLKPES